MGIEQLVVGTLAAGMGIPAAGIGIPFPAPGMLVLVGRSVAAPSV